MRSWRKVGGPEGFGSDDDDDGGFGDDGMMMMMIMMIMMFDRPNIYHLNL